jgi:hypothetical protein
VQNTAETTLPGTESGSSRHLARFFPELERAHTRAFLTLPRPGSGNLREVVLVEFAAFEKVIFSSALPVEFGDTISLANEAGNQVEARVIAVQFQDERTAVAAQVLNGQFSWASRP